MEYQYLFASHSLENLFKLNPQLLNVIHQNTRLQWTKYKIKP